MSKYFPPLSNDALWAFSVIFEHLLSDPEYLEHEECPYPRDFREKLSKIKAKTTISEAEIEEIDLESEAHTLFLELRESKDHLTSDDNAERMSYFRTATSLLDKLIGMRERANNIKRVSAFYSSVLGVMEEVLEPAQVTVVRNRLKDFVE
jgi:hypothetical protein